MTNPRGLPRGFFESFASEAKFIVVRSEREARLRSHRQVPAADMLVVLADFSPLLIESVCGDSGLTAARLRDASPVAGGADPMPEGDRIPFAEDLKSALTLTARIFASRGATAAQVTPVHLLGGLAAAPDSTAVRMLAAARADIDVARRRVALLLDSVHGPARTSPVGPAVRKWAKRATGGEPQQSAEDRASVAAYAEYQRISREATDLMMRDRLRESARLWQQLAALHPAEPAVLVTLARCLTLMGRWDESAIRLREAMTVTQREDAWGAEARNSFAWESVTQELIASGTVDPATLHAARQAAEDAVACWPLNGYLDTLARIHVFQGSPGSAMDMLRPVVNRTSAGAVHRGVNEHLACLELTCALAYRALGDTDEALRLLASARERKFPAPLTEYQSRYTEWAAEAIHSGRIPGNPASRPT